MISVLIFNNLERTIQNSNKNTAKEDAKNITISAKDDPYTFKRRSMEYDSCFYNELFLGTIYYYNE